MAYQDKIQSSPRNEMRIEFWRLKIYSYGFVVVFALHLALNGIERPPVLLFIAAVTLCIGVWVGQGPWLKIGVMLGILHALFFPILQRAFTNGESIAAVVAGNLIWPQLLVTLIGSRVLETESKLSFAQFWQRPTKRRLTVEMQSIPSAIAFGSFLTLVFYMVVPWALTPSTKQPLDIVVSAMLGGQSFTVHSFSCFL